MKKYYITRTAGKSLFAVHYSNKEAQQVARFKRLDRLNNFINTLQAKDYVLIVN